MIIAGWIFIGILVFLALALIFKFQDVIFIFGLVKKYMFPIVMIVLILFFAFSINHVNKNYDVSLKSPEGIMKVGEVYFGWAKAAFSNVGKITGYIVNQDWSLNSSSVQINEKTRNFR